VALRDSVDSTHSPVEFREGEARAHLIKGTGLVPSRETSSCGQAAVDFLVDAQGRVQAASASGGWNANYAAVEREVRSWAFTPFLKDGAPVIAKFRMSIWVEPEGVSETPDLAFPEIKDRRSLQVTLQRGACYGQCPSYDIEIRGDGTVTYDGKGYVAVVGRHTDRIPITAVSELIEELRGARFFSLKDKYFTCHSHGTMHTTMVSVDGQMRGVLDFNAAPEALRTVGTAIDRIADVDKWRWGNSAVVGSLEREGLDFRSIEASAILARIAVYGSPETIREFVQRGTRLEDLPETHLALMTASRREDDEAFRLLLRAGIAARSQGLQNEALYWSLARGDVNMAERLIRQGADATATFGYDSDIGRRFFFQGYPFPVGDTMLMAAIRSGKAEAVSTILKYHPDPNMADRDGRTALVMAYSFAGKRDIETLARMDKIADLLIAAGADINAETERGTILHFSWQPELVRSMIRRGADVNRRNQRGEAPIFMAYDEEAALLLIDAGADPSVRNSRGESVQEFARRSKWTKVLSRLDAH
jgi:ankyrin repeat protein